MPTVADLQNVKRQTYVAKYKGQDLGFFKVDTLKVGVNGQYSEVEVDQLAAKVAKAYLDGYDLSVQLTLMRTDPDFVAGVVLGGTLGLKTGTKGDLFGFGDPQVDLDSVAGTLELIPSNYQSGDRLNSWIFWKAYAKAENLEIAGGKNTWQEVTITFNVLPDLNQDPLFRYGAWGNLDAEGTNPLGLTILMGQAIPQAPISLGALTLNPGAVDDLRVIEAHGENVGSAAINEATGITASQTTFNIDTISASDLVSVGKVLLVDSEFMLVTGGVNGTAGTVTVVRGIWGSTPATHADNAAITVYGSVRYYDATQLASWASDNTAAVNVGNVANATDNNRRGRIAHVAAGSANITATKGTASVSVAVTAA